MIEQLKVSYSAKDSHWRVVDHTSHSLQIAPIHRNWRGYGETRVLGNGIILGRGDVFKSHAGEDPDMAFRCHLGLHIFLTGSLTYRFSDGNRSLEVGGQQIWRRSGDLGTVKPTWRQSQLLRLLTLDFTPDLLLRWQESFALPRWLEKRGNAIELLPNLLNKRLLMRAEQIIAQPINTLNELLELEGLVLTLCKDMVAPAQSLRQKKIDDVIDIVLQEYHRNLTICDLAARVGINECYLKRDFKAATGKTIAAYIRDLRLQEAMRLLLDEQKSVKETAFYVGYRDVAHFRKIFKSHFGVSPNFD